MPSSAYLKLQHYTSDNKLVGLIEGALALSAPRPKYCMVNNSQPLLLYQLLWSLTTLSLLAAQQGHIGLSVNWQWAYICSHLGTRNFLTLPSSLPSWGRPRRHWGHLTLWSICPTSRSTIAQFIIGNGRELQFQRGGLQTERPKMTKMGNILPSQPRVVN